MSSILVSFASGVSMTVSLSFGLLSFVATTPVEFQGMATGLLGNFNDDITDEFMFPNGTVLDSDSADMDIHEFGQSCKNRYFFCNSRLLAIGMARLPWSHIGVQGKAWPV